MKTKKYITYGFLAATLIVATSCNLDEYNPSGATAEEIWSNPEGFVTVVNAAYSEQRAWYGKEDGLFMAEAGTDLWYNRDRNSYARQLTRYEGLSPADGNPNKAAWRDLFKAINICNAGINRIDDAGFTDITERNQREGELRFLRGFYYWHVVETWGGVMLRTTETQTAELTATRSPVEDFYELIISDLQFAAEHLPNDWGAEYSRATKKSALGFLARAYLSRAYYSTGAERDSYFTLAKNTAQEVIDRQDEFEIELWSDYADLWDSSNNKDLGKPGGEALYVVSNSTDPTLNYDLNSFRVHTTFLTPYSNKPGLVQSLEYGYPNDRRLMPTLALLDFFDEEIDARYSGSFQEVWIANTDYTWTAGNAATYLKSPSIVGQEMTAGVDTALYITKKSVSGESTKLYVVVDRDSVYNTGTDNSIRTGRDFVSLKKYMDPYRDSPTSRVGFNDVVVMRLAEMYLIAAEADLQLGDADGAAGYINVLRTRAAVKTPVDRTADMQITGGEVTLDFILDERARELAGEYIRWFDLKRTGTLVSRVNQYNPDITLIQGFHSLRPVPIAETQALLNPLEFGQNPGY